MTRRQGARLATLLSVVILAFFAFGFWLSKPQQGEPMQWRTAYEDSLWGPLQRQQLTLGEASDALGHGLLAVAEASAKRRVLCAVHPARICRGQFSTVSV